MTEQMNMPKLRFSEFEGEYIDTALEDLTKKKISYGIVQAGPHIPDGMPYIKSTNLNKELCLEELERTSDAIAKSYQRSEVAPEDIVFSLRGNIGATRIVPETIPVANLTQGTARLSIGENFSNVYINYCLSTRKAYKRVNSVSKGSTFQEISLADLRKVKVTHSVDIKEQQKIASFLSKVDEKITLLTEKKDKLTEYKKGVMQQLFNGKWEKQDGQLTFIPPTLRFKADDGSEFPIWEEKKLGQVFTRIRRKNKENNQNVLTISAQQGLINQEKYFNKSVAAKDVTGYYLLENGDFAYNKSYSKGYPMGAIKRLNNYDKGVVSTLYICFGLNKGFVSDFFEHYFESGLQNRDLSKIAQEGARNHGLLNISVDEFFKDVKLLTPSHDEQLKIANFLSAIDQKIDLANSELEKAKEWKKGLLQQMFV
ncbi:restriction endonuclease subunit S [Vibrio nigripulchritudo]|uniref:restriction endonuclease subunit S n=1 Tax=Vibrio nigripulchritudo TaxID=28173 RepID=UPI002490A441|nr:restriction endonuclease subunit S [Vibrio nigripulchritudo]BDU37866.1 hypothetical protein TUMSATVNIG2_23350 [Vibrio nigripulchritudo]BDU43587.1 hypothetical protein TUMSATVNIG3_23850 [Vibrio nigripulchritudo]